MTYLWGILAAISIVMMVIHGIDGDDVKEIKSVLWVFISFYMIHRIKDGK